MKAKIEFFVKFLRLVSILTEKKFERTNRNFVVMIRISRRNLVSSLEKSVATIYYLACEISPTLEQLMHQNFAEFRRSSFSVMVKIESDKNISRTQVVPYRWLQYSRFYNPCVRLVFLSTLHSCSRRFLRALQRPEPSQGVFLC